MTYIRVQWLHSSPNEPVWLVSELDDRRREVRKVEVFANGSKGYATRDEEVGGTRLGVEPLPSIAEIAADPQFLVSEINKETFEVIWERRTVRNSGGRTLHSSGLVPECLAAQVLDFIAQGRLGLLGLAAAADVVSAECRFNHWVATHLKKAALSELQWMRLLEANARNDERCRTAMATFRSGGGTLQRLCAELSPVTAWLNQRSLEAMIADVKPILPTVHRAIGVERRAGGSLVATFEADGGSEYTLSMPIKIYLSSSRQMEPVGYWTPTLFERDPTKCVWLSWDDARALLHAISNVAEGLSRHQLDLLGEMESIAAAEGRLASGLGCAPMLKVFTDFNARTVDGVCWILVYQGSDLDERTDELHLRKGDKIILFQDKDDFEVTATLDVRYVDVLGRVALVAIPDWSTLERK
jgi:hypothetical protein